ncbi:hypothetical protein GCM10023322_30450 [Rugosimonospora acidiphila]|uniref:Uncharacterized protein n=1 Tax=Rugosimonospora acidiphila TaxID=556531 RepID=A0ABP9RRJ0_9ACTN
MLAHWTCVNEACGPRRIVGWATVNTVPSKETIIAPVTLQASVTHRWWSAPLHASRACRPGFPSVIDVSTRSP